MIDFFFIQISGLSSISTGAYFASQLVQYDFFLTSVVGFCLLGGICSISTAVLLLLALFAHKVLQLALWLTHGQ